jgi:dTDP-glucose 4,6-dehydratase
LKWKSKVNFKKGINLTFEWYLNNNKYYNSLSKEDILNRLGNKK